MRGGDRPRRAREPGSRASIVKAGAGRASRGRAMRRAMLADGRAAGIPRPPGGPGGRPRGRSGLAGAPVGRAGLRGLGARRPRSGRARRPRGSRPCAACGLRLGDADLEHALVEAGRDLLGVDAVGERERAPEGAELALDADVALALVPCSAARSPDTVRTPSSTSSLTSSSASPGRSALRTKDSSDSTRSIAGIHRRVAAPTPAAEPPGASKNVPNSRFTSCCSDASSRAGSQRTSAMW